MTQGREVGELARLLFPGGTLISPTSERTSVELTQGALADRSTHALFEAAFGAGIFAAKADILAREGAGWHLLEVKSSFSDTRDIGRYVDDLAYTAMVSKRTGLLVTRASLVLLSREYRYGQSVDSLFEVVDVTAEVDRQSKVFHDGADDVALTLLGEQPPPSTLVTACRQCGYFADRCVGAGHEHTVLELPYLHHTKLKKLSDAGLVGLKDVPPDFGLSERQLRVQAAAVNGAPEIDRDRLRTALDSIEWPCRYLDFESVQTAMPLYEGHGCYRPVVTQFSLHHRATPQSTPAHSAFLADATRAQETELALALIDAAGDNGSVLAYSSFEKTRLEALRSGHPELDEELNAVINRLVDLSVIVTSHVYHPEFRGRSSIKAVLPALVPEMSYDGLAIGDGETAIARFAQMARGEISGDAVTHTRKQLLEYCQLDTLAMVRLHDALLAMVA